MTISLRPVVDSLCTPWHFPILHGRMDGYLWSVVALGVSGRLECAVSYV